MYPGALWTINRAVGERIRLLYADDAQGQGRQLNSLVSLAVLCRRTSPQPVTLTFGQELLGLIISYSLFLFTTGICINVKHKCILYYTL
jgi:hypothetical protein